MIRKTDRQILQRLWTDWVLIYRGRLGMIFLLMVVVAAAGGLYPALISHVFDAHRDRFAFLSLPDDPFIAIPALIILVASIKAAAMYFQVLGVNSLALRITTDIQKAMSAHLIGADLAVVSAEPAGAFISRIMNDLNLVREALVRLANNLVRDILTILVMVTVMVWFSWLLSLLVLAVYP
ncbi:MAG: ABC transporter transmembrane domain-containing protein, partial [Alphaproteobacteria bacterium]